MWLNISRVILRYRSVFVWIILVVTYFMIQKSTDVRLSYSMANLLPKNSEAQLNYNFFLEKFGIKDNVMIVGVNSKYFFEYENFQSWKKLHQNFKNVDGVKNVLSIFFLHKET